MSLNKFSRLQKTKRFVSKVELKCSVVPWVRPRGHDCLDQHKITKIGQDRKTTWDHRSTGLPLRSRGSLKKVYESRKQERKDARVKELSLSTYLAAELVKCVLLATYE